MKIWAVVRTRFEGQHRYPKAPKEVAFLRKMHRHMFHVVVHIEQSHVNRDIEYIMFLHWVEGELKHLPSKKSASCEAMAVELLGKIRAEYPRRAVRVEINEDGENGAIVEYV